MMKRLHVNVHIVDPAGRRLTPVDLAKELDEKPNQSESLRE
jgi:hypothetical protein